MVTRDNPYSNKNDSYNPLRRTISSKGFEHRLSSRDEDLEAGREFNDYITIHYNGGWVAHGHELDEVLA